jgi:hypothetical protein
MGEATIRKVCGSILGVIHMSTTASFREIVPPIILDENGDVQAFSSIESVTRYVEVVDVLNDEFSFYDSIGRVLKAQVLKGKVHLVPTSVLESDSVALRSRIIRVLSLLGVSEETSARASFSELARLLLERSQRKRG